MPIKIPDNLPAKKILQNEKISIIGESRALHQDIRPLRIIILNLMPTKVETETQLLRLLSNTPLQIEIELLKTSTYTSKNTSAEHLINFYKSFSQVKDNKYDGLIITGAPVENLEFKDIDYWDELSSVMEWSLTNVTSTFHICWAAQAGLYYHYGVNKYPTDKKIFGIFEHTVSRKSSKLLRGFDDTFYAPHSRHTELREEDVKNVKGLEILAKSDEAGIYIIKAKKGRQFFVTGHSEYDDITLANEYFRDLDKGLNPQIPYNYFIDDNPKKPIKQKWRSHASLLFSNWLNYYVYQETPYIVDKIK